MEREMRERFIKAKQIRLILLKEWKQFEKNREENLVPVALQE